MALVTSALSVPAKGNTGDTYLLRIRIYVLAIDFIR